MRLVLATANPHKAVEMAAVLSAATGSGGGGGSAFEVVPHPAGLPDVEETADTLEGNSRLKAQAVSAATGEAAVADDTGLEVDALGGAPGAYSARFAGEDATYADNVAKLLALLDGVPASGRRATFRTVVVALFPDGREVVVDGVCEGRIAEAPAGGGGFGYDPVFIPDDGDGRTFAQMTAAEKEAVSHRGRALRALAASLSP